jgi:hypothetical protein
MEAAGVEPASCESFLKNIYTLSQIVTRTIDKTSRIIGVQWTTTIFARLPRLPTVIPGTNSGKAMGPE